MAATHPVINSPDDALRELKAGISVSGIMSLSTTTTPWKLKKNEGRAKPHSLILVHGLQGCRRDNFRSGIGHIFVTRVAGNIDDDDISGSMEYAVEHAGAKLIVVMATPNAALSKVQLPMQSRESYAADC